MNLSADLRTAFRVTYTCLDQTALAIAHHTRAPHGAAEREATLAASVASALSRIGGTGIAAIDDARATAASGGPLTTLFGRLYDAHRAVQDLQMNAGLRRAGDYAWPDTVGGCPRI